jgi:hypothetical protein
VTVPLGSGDEFHIKKVANERPSCGDGNFRAAVVGEQLDIRDVRRPLGNWGVLGYSGPECHPLGSERVVVPQGWEALINIGVIRARSRRGSGLGCTLT